MVNNAAEEHKKVRVWEGPISLAFFTDSQSSPAFIYKHQSNHKNQKGNAFFSNGEYKDAISVSIYMSRRCGITD